MGGGVWILELPQPEVQDPFYRMTLQGPRTGLNPFGENLKKQNNKTKPNPTYQVDLSTKGFHDAGGSRGLGRFGVLCGGEMRISWGCD